MADIGRDLNIEADNNSNDTWASAVEKRIGYFSYFNRICKLASETSQLTAVRVERKKRI